MNKVKLASLCDVINGYAFKSSDYVPTGHRVVRITNVQKGLVVDNDPKFVPEEIANKANNFKLNLGDILISLTGNVGRVGRIKAKYLPAVLNQRVGCIRPKSRDLHDRYLFQYLNSDYFEREAISNSNGIAQLNLSSKWIEAHEIPLPSLAEQKRIAAILDKADAIRRKRQAAIKLADDFLRATFLDMFGDPVTNPKGWEVKPVGQLLADKQNAARTGPFGSQLKHSEFITEGIPVLGIDNVVTNNFRWTNPRCLPPEKYEGFKRYQVFPDDIIITIMGTTGRVAVAPADLPECMSTKHLCVLTLNKDEIDPVFLWATLLYDYKARDQAKRSSGGAIMEGWNMGIIKEICVRVPPLKKQRQFRLVIEKMKQLKEKKLSFWGAQSGNLFNSLTQRAFRGEL